MNCEKYQILLDDDIEGELDAPDAAQVAAHAAICAECAAYREQLVKEKAIYAQYLFSAEPPPDLWIKTLAKIETENAAPPASAARETSGALSRKPHFFNRLRLYPALGFAAALVAAAALGFAALIPRESVSENASVAQIESNAGQLKAEQFVGNDREEIEDPSIKVDLDQRGDSAKIVKANRQADVLNQKIGGQGSINRLKTSGAKTKSAFASNKFASPKAAEARAAQREWRALELENRQQIEKIELLLRAFRNTRAADGGTVYDVAYERQQARRLLDKNVRLRRLAEISGNFYAEEILSRAETILLDIANLENEPPPEEILTIKERVKNQNIIASLQVY